MRESKRIKRLFTLAICLTLIIVCANYLLLRHFMTTQDHVASMIDLSGKQRMYSQKAIIWSNKLIAADNDTKRERARDELKAIATEILEANRLLTDPNTHIGKVTQNNKALMSLYFRAPTRLDGMIHIFTYHINQLAEAKDATLNKNNPHYAYITHNVSDKLITNLERAVALHKQENHKDLRILHSASLSLYIGALAIIAGLSWLIFIPVMRNVNSSIRLMELQQKVTIAANESDSIQDSIKYALDRICEFAEWPLGHAYIFNAENNTLSSMKLWHYNDKERFADLIDISEQSVFLPQQDLIGKAYVSSELTWLLNIQNAPDFLRKKAVNDANLHATYVFPISVSKKVVAVMEFFTEETSPPSQSFLKVMTNIAKQLGQTFERAQFQEHAQLLETIISSANDGIIVTKANLNAPGPEIVYVNKAFTEISGYSAEEAIGRCPRFLQSEFTKQETLAELRAALDEGKPFKDELLNQHKNGENYWLDISIVPIKNSLGVITHFAAIERDITAKKKEELNQKNMWLQLKRANLKVEAAARDLQDSLTKAQEASKAKSDFLANMSHELRTPMNGVLGMAHLLADTTLNQEQKDFVSTINGSAENLLMLLNDILDFSKIEAGALQLEHIPFSMSDAIHNTANLLRLQAEKKNVELLVDCEPLIPANIWGDSGRTKQVIMNLLGNAIKFTEHGYVRLSARLQEKDEAQFIVINVQDTGLGIPAHKLEMIFDKFTQGDTSITRKYGGTGLGLAITKQLVTLMGGEIGVESAEGKGSTFWFSIPCVEATAQDIDSHKDKRSTRATMSDNAIPIGQAKALLVEDYHVNQVFAMKLLKKFGFTHIDLAENGLEALERLRKDDYHIIFMDCQMPELDGYQATQKIRLIEEGTPKHTPIVAMTANAMMGDREKCLKAGMDDYLSKPLRAEHLKTILQTWFILNETPSTANPSASAIAVSAYTEEKTSEEAPINLEQLRSFTDGDPEEEKLLAQLFIDQANEMIQLLAESTQKEACETWKSAAHRFKGASGNLGAMQLHHLCKRAETDFEDPAPQKHKMLEAIKQETARVASYFQHVSMAHNATS